MISTKRIFRFILCPAAVTLILAQSACYKDSKEAMFPTTGCDTTSITWTKDIQPIVNNSCTASGCHDARSQSGGYALNTYEGVKTIVDNTRFLAVIEAGTMPKSSPKLDDCTINKIKRWINTGAEQN
ncbi:MAG TPA: hypothetical protein VL092_13440 [Chitinophagaceae bacterium]|nr:hypothetical protein [Chitinophagaceae bacterium]